MSKPEPKQERETDPELELNAEVIQDLDAIGEDANDVRGGDAAPVTPNCPGTRPPVYAATGTCQCRK
jgi:hypothetical protein